MLKSKKLFCLFVSLVMIMYSCCFSAVADRQNVPVIAKEDNINDEAYPDITAKSAIVIDGLSGNVLYQKKCDEKSNVSHLVKLMTLLETMKTIKSGKLKMDTMNMTSNHANSMGDPQIWLNVGEKISTEDLIKSVTIGNANDGSVVLSEAVASTEQAFVKRMNDSAKCLGLKNTNYMNCTGIETENQYSSARDVAVVASQLLKFPELEQYFTTWMTNIRDGQTELVSTNKLVRTYKGITGMKAAASDKAGNCLVATARRNNLSLVCVILGSSSNDSKFDEAKKLMDTAFSLNQVYKPEIPEEALVSMQVKKGQQKTVDLERQGLSGIVIKRGLSSKVEVNVVREESLIAPVTKGQEIGRIEYFIDKKLIATEKLYAKKDVKKIGFKYAFKTLLDKLSSF